MSDLSLRDLRRRAKADPSLEPQLLMARLRAGELTIGQLTCAAVLDHEPARLALGWAKPSDPPKLDPTNAWPGPLLRLTQNVNGQDVSRISHEAIVRIAVAAGRLVMRHEAWSNEVAAGVAARSLRTAEDWILAPGPHTQAACGRALFPNAWYAFPAEAAAHWAPGVPVYWARFWSSCLLSLSNPNASSNPITPGERLLRAVLGEALPWALGEADPVLARVIAGQVLPVDPSH